MYVLINTREDKIEVPNSWSSKIITLLCEPRIINKLPDGVAAGKPVNKREYQEGYYSYDYYVDCGHASHYVIGRALKALAKKLAHEVASLDPIINPNTYPNENPVVELFKKVLQTKVEKYARLNFFSKSNEGLQSELVPGSGLQIK